MAGARPLRRGGKGSMVPSPGSAGTGVTLAGSTLDAAMACFPTSKTLSRDDLAGAMGGRGLSARRTLSSDDMTRGTLVEGLAWQAGVIGSGDDLPG